MSTREPKNVQTVMRSVWLAQPPETVFAFCASADGFQAQNPKPVLEYRGEPHWVEGSEFFVRYKQFGIPTNWHGKVTAYETGRYFRDVMLSGMFRFWEHTHSVEPEKEGTRYTSSTARSSKCSSRISSNCATSLLVEHSQDERE